MEECQHEINGTVVPGGSNTHFVAAHYHCHAPTCLSMEIWTNSTGELRCEVGGGCTGGELLCREEPYYGQGANMGPATGDSDRFDEPG